MQKQIEDVLGDVVSEFHRAEQEWIGDKDVEHAEQRKRAHPGIGRAKSPFIDALLDNLGQRLQQTALGSLSVAAETDLEL